VVGNDSVNVQRRTMLLAATVSVTFALTNDRVTEHVKMAARMRTIDTLSY
jgi:hypothetical protein